MGPSLIRLVAIAIAVSATHGSAIGMACSGLPPMWSHTKKPSHPASSASWANSVIRRASLKLPKFGVLIANCISISSFHQSISLRVLVLLYDIFCHDYVKVIIWKVIFLQILTLIL